MKDMNRAQRRHHRDRMTARAKLVMRQTGWNFLDEESVHVRARKFADNMKNCSCWMCKNERGSEGPPISEIRNGHGLQEED